MSGLIIYPLAGETTVNQLWFWSILLNLDQPLNNLTILVTLPDTTRLDSVKGENITIKISLNRIKIILGNQLDTKILITVTAKEEDSTGWHHIIVFLYQNKMLLNQSLASLKIFPHPVLDLITLQQEVSVGDEVNYTIFVTNFLLNLTHIYFTDYIPQNLKIISVKSNFGVVIIEDAYINIGILSLDRHSPNLLAYIETKAIAPGNITNKYTMVSATTPKEIYSNLERTIILP